MGGRVGDDPDAADARVRFCYFFGGRRGGGGGGLDAVLEDARGGGVDDAPVAVDGGAGDGAGGVGVEEEGEAGGACCFCWWGVFVFGVSGVGWGGVCFCWWGGGEKKGGGRVLFVRGWMFGLRGLKKKKKEL